MSSRFPEVWTVSGLAFRRFASVFFFNFVIFVFASVCSRKPFIIRDVGIR